MSFPKNSAFDQELRTGSVAPFSQPTQASARSGEAEIPYSALEDWVHRLRTLNQPHRTAVESRAAMDDIDEVVDEIESYLRG
jgi:hypothetical protein